MQNIASFEYLPLSTYEPFTSAFHWKCPFQGQQWLPLCYNKFIGHASSFPALLYHWTKLTAPSPLKLLLGFRHPALSWFFLIPLQPFSVFASSSSCPWFLYIGTFLLQSLTPLFFLSPSLLTLWVMSYSFLVLNAICQRTSLSSHLLRGHLMAPWQAQPGCLCLGKCLKPDASETEPLLLPGPAPVWSSPVFWPASPPFQWLRPQHLWSLPWLLVLPCLTSNPLANSLVSASEEPESELLTPWPAGPHHQRTSPGWWLLFPILISSLISAEQSRDPI